MAGKPDWEALQGAIAGDVALPGSPAFSQSQMPFNARFDDVRPQAVVLCATPEDVAETISFVVRYGLEAATRSGGHSFAGHSSTRGVVIDVTPMRSASVSGTVAYVGAGVRSGDLYETLERHDLTIPAGTCPPVGVAGLTLGGGLGILGRKYGLTSDHLLAAQIVLADGHIVECDENRNQDLFWALRGAGAGNFGVVTSLTFRTVPVPAVTNFHLTWPHSHAPAVIDAWQGWAPVGPDELAASLKVTSAADADQPPSVDVFGALLGSESDATELIDELVARTGSDPTSAFRKGMSFPETRRFWAQLGAVEDGAEGYQTTESSRRPYLFSRSEFFMRPLPGEVIAALVENFSQGRRAGESRELDFMPWGGAYNRVRSDATAFVHRRELFQLKHAVVVDPQASMGDKQSAHRWVTGSWNLLHPWGSGRVFQNFADPDLGNWTDAYYGSNLERLVRVKARYDPTEFFRFHQSVPAR
jgi:FAD/FMN-containing dehydrogenase